MSIAHLVAYAVTFIAIVAFWAWVQYRSQRAGINMLLPLALQLLATVALILIAGPALRHLSFGEAIAGKATPNPLDLAAYLFQLGGLFRVFIWSFLANLGTAALMSFMAKREP